MHILKWFMIKNNMIVYADIPTIVDYKTLKNV